MPGAEGRWGPCNACWQKQPCVENPCLGETQEGSCRGRSSSRRGAVLPFFTRKVADFLPGEFRAPLEMLLLCLEGMPGLHLTQH